MSKNMFPSNSKLRLCNPSLKPLVSSSRTRTSIIWNPSISQTLFLFIYTCLADVQNHILHITKRTCLQKVANLHQQLCAPPIPNVTYSSKWTLCLESMGARRTASRHRLHEWLDHYRSSRTASRHRLFRLCV